MLQISEEQPSPVFVVSIRKFLIVASLSDDRGIGLISLKLFIKIDSASDYMLLRSFVNIAPIPTDWKALTISASCRMIAKDIHGLEEIHMTFANGSVFSDHVAGGKLTVKAGHSSPPL